MARQTKAQIAAIELANVKAAQAAELKRLRAAKAAKTRAANKAAAHAASTQPDALHANIETLFDDLELPSAKRVLVGMLLSVAASGLVGYGIGMLLSYAIAGIMVLTATSWIAFTLTVIAWVIALVAAWKLGGYVGGKVFSSVVMPEGLASRSYESVAKATGNTASRVGGWFTSSKDVAAAKLADARTVVTGAFVKPIVQAAV